MTSARSSTAVRPAVRGGRTAIMRSARADSKASSTPARNSARTSIRVGTLVLNNDFRHPVVVAREAAAVDVLTGGRLELGLGAGHMKHEYDAAGITFDRAATRVAARNLATRNFAQNFGAGRSFGSTFWHLMPMRASDWSSLLRMSPCSSPVCRSIDTRM